MSYPFKGGGNAQASDCNFLERTSEKSLFFSQLFCVMFVIIHLQNNSTQYNTYFTYFDICKNR